MKGDRGMTREIYLKKFSRAVRWRLPPKEAEEAIADYRELVFQEKRDESRLVEELGDPVQAARLLTDVKSYRRWLAVFGILALGLVLMAKWCILGRSQLDYFLGKTRYWFPVLVLMVGLVLSQYWFRRYEQKRGPLSRRLILGLVLVLAVGAIPLGWTWYVSRPEFLERLAQELFPGPVARQAWMLQYVLRYGGCACTLIALAGLVLAKLFDRRWLALYTLALTMTALCVILIFWTRSMSLPWYGVNELQFYYFPRMVLVGIAGLVGTGVALC